MGNFGSKLRNGVMEVDCYVFIGQLNVQLAKWTIHIVTDGVD